MKEKKVYEIPKEVAKHINDYVALCDLRDVCAKIPFGYKKAKRAAIEASVARRKFWAEVYELYPELPNKNLRWNGDKGVVEIAENAS